MVCIYCGAKTRVSNSRSSSKSLTSWRRRKCDHCKSIFTTRETIDYSGALRVKKISNDLQPFSRDKLLISIYSSLLHRKTALDDAESLTATAIASLLTRHNKGVLAAQQITKTVEDILSNFDKAAATHYKAHHVG